MHRILNSKNCDYFLNWLLNVEYCLLIQVLRRSEICTHINDKQIGMPPTIKRRTQDFVEYGPVARTLVNANGPLNVTMLRPLGLPPACVGGALRRLTEG